MYCRRRISDYRYRSSESGELTEKYQMCARISTVYGTAVHSQAGLGSPAVRKTPLMKIEAPLDHLESLRFLVDSS